MFGKIYCSRILRNVALVGFLLASVITLRTIQTQHSGIYTLNHQSNSLKTTEAFNYGSGIDSRVSQHPVLQIEAMLQLDLDHANSHKPRGILDSAYSQIPSESPDAAQTISSRGQLDAEIKPETADIFIQNDVPLKDNMTIVEMLQQLESDINKAVISKHSKGKHIPRRPLGSLRSEDPFFHRVENGLRILQHSHRKVSLNCPAIITGTDRTAVKEALRYRLTQNVLIYPESYILFTKKCDIFRKSRGYIFRPVNDEETRFPIAFSILTYRTVEQTERLLRAIYRPQNYYCIHVDAKMDYASLQALRGIASCLPNVFLSDVRYDVKWGTFSVLEPEIACMRQLLAYKRWRYFINLTGQEFPLRTNWELVQILKEYNGANDIQGSFTRYRKVRGRTDYRYVDNVYRTSMRKPPPPHGIRLTKGAVHIAASRKFVEYVINARVARDFLQWTKDTRIPDETFFTTLNHNPQLDIPGSFIGDEAAVENKGSMIRFKRWAQNGTCPGRSTRVVHDICVVGVELLPEVTQSPELFVNKLDLAIQPAALHCLEAWLGQRVSHEYSSRATGPTLNMTLYAQLPFVISHV